MAELYNKPLKKTDDWGGVINSVGKRLPASGKTVQAFIKESLQKRIGYIYEDEQNKKYIGFADAEDFESYFNDNPDNTNFHNEDLVIQRWDLPKSGIGYIYQDRDSEKYIAFTDVDSFNTYMTNPQEHQDLVIQTWDFLGISIGDTAPSNTNNLWIDTSNTAYQENPPYDLQQEVFELRRQLDVLMGLRTQGVISGKINDGARTTIIANATPEIPQEILDSYNEALENEEITQEEYDQYISGEITNQNDIKPDDYASGEEPTTSHISIKRGTNLNEIRENKNNLVDGEFAWDSNDKKLYLYENGQLYSAGKGDDDSSGGIDEDQLKGLLSNLESISFVPMFEDPEKENGKRFTVRVDPDGKIICYDSSLDNKAQFTGGYQFDTETSYVSKSGLLINSFYLGGDADEHSYLPCSHNFVELSNVAMKKGSPQEYQDINLNGYYLFYKGHQSGWKKLPLWGKIKGGGTFLIRGAQCSVMDSNTTKIKVKSYDMEWKDDEGNLVKFDKLESGQGHAVFYIGCTDLQGNIHHLNNENVDEALNINNYGSIQKLWVKGSDDNIITAQGYADLVGINSDNGLFENKAYTIPNKTGADKITSDDIIFRRWYMLDPVTQSNPKEGVSKHNNKKYLGLTLLNGADYDPDMDIAEFTPKASFENKTIANTRSLFSEEYPSTLTCTFGIQATDNTIASNGYNNASEIHGVRNSTGTDGVGATRGFCWNSVGYYDEGIKYKKEGNSTWTEVLSIEGETGNVEKYYNRIRWESAYGQSITTHKVLLRGLTEGTYTYKVYRVGDENYTSDERTFTVRKDSSVENFTFVQTTDQQGANWEEYELWHLSAMKIKKEELDENIPNFDFTINTGDICYNGSRSNEWIDYYNGYKHINNREEMLTVGNNDLAPTTMRDIGTGAESPYKIDVGVIDYFYCVEIDEANPQIFYGRPYEAEDSDTNAGEREFKIPSLYSFNYGKFHFLSLLSEIRTISNNTNDDGSQKKMEVNTVTKMFGVKDDMRIINPEYPTEKNTRAAVIFDIEESWIIRDLIKWKMQENGSLPSAIEAKFTTMQSLADNRDDLEHPHGRETKPYDYLMANRFDPLIKEACSKCIVFTHEMPFNIVSDSSYDNYEIKNAKVPRETAKAYLNTHHDFEFQRVFKIWGIKLVMGGHKHTAAMTHPVYDAPLNYNPITDLTGEGLFELESGANSFNDEMTFQPMVQITKQDYLNNLNQGGFANIKNTLFQSGGIHIVYNNTGDNTIPLPQGDVQTDSSGNIWVFNTQSGKAKARLEIVNSITAPQYVMCQATGYKNKSNSDLASQSRTIPWERHYIQGADDPTGQAYPFFTVYEVTDSDVTVSMYKISGFYTASTKAGYWDIVKYYNKSQTTNENRLRLVNSSQINLFGDESVTINL